MTASLLPAAVSLLGLVAVSAAILLTMLILRNPHLPKSFRNEAVAHAASLVLTTSLLFVVSEAAAELAAVDLHYGIVVLIIAGVLSGSAFMFWKLFNIASRLARAESGQSPFAGRKMAAAMPVAALEAAPTG